jgi:hypothetical protein
VSGNAITISVAGGSFTSGVGCIGGYAPRVGDVVAVFRQDSSWLIIGRTAGANPWNRMSSLGYQNGWTDRGTGYPVGQWRVIGAAVQIIGQINNASIVANGSAICTGLPAPPGEVAGIFGEQGTTRPGLHIDTAGAFRVYNATASGIMQFNATYPTDFL